MLSIPGSKRMPELEFRFEIPKKGLVGYLSVLIVLSLITFFLFNVHLNVFFIACGFYAVERVVGFATNRGWLKWDERVSAESKITGS